MNEIVQKTRVTFAFQAYELVAHALKLFDYSRCNPLMGGLKRVRDYVHYCSPGSEVLASHVLDSSGYPRSINPH